jgi:hypothetical protein
MRKPDYWKTRKGWYVNTGKTQIKLGTTKKEAFEKWHELAPHLRIGTGCTLSPLPNTSGRGSK